MLRKSNARLNGKKLAKLRKPEASQGEGDASMNDLIIAKNSKRLFIVFLLILPFFISNCTSLKSQSRGYDRPDIEIIIESEPKKIKAASIGIFDFNNPTELIDLGCGLAQLAHKHLLKNSFIQLVELTRMYPGNVEDAIKIGRNKGYDLIFLGYINDFFYGGLSANSKVDISIRVIDVRTKVTLWYITGHMEGQYKKLTDYILFVKDSKEAPSPYLLCSVVMNELLNILTKK